MKQELYPYQGNKTTARVAYGFPPTVVSKTKNITDAIGYVGDAATRRGMAKEALLRDPGCILSHMVVAKHAKTIEERLFHLEMARDAGLELWTPVAHALGSRMAWWEIEDTKPFLHALNALGEAYEEANDFLAAKDTFEMLLRLDRQDHFYVTKDRVPRSGVRATSSSYLRRGWPVDCQAGTADSMTMGSSLNGAMVSRVI